MNGWDPTVQVNTVPHIKLCELTILDSPVMLDSSMAREYPVIRTPSAGTWWKNCMHSANWKEHIYTYKIIINICIKTQTWSPIFRGTTSPTTRSKIETSIRFLPLITCVWQIIRYIKLIDPREQKNIMENMHIYWMVVSCQVITNSKIRVTKMKTLWRTHLHLYISLLVI